MGNGAKAQQKRDRKGDDKTTAKSQLKTVSRICRASLAVVKLMLISHE
jgi:hypothetical protein